MSIPRILKSSLIGLMTLSPFFCIAQTIVINEIHYDENDKTVRAEFIELYNVGEETIDLSNWYFSEGIDFNFQEGVTIGAGNYLIIAEDPQTIESQFKVSDALGPFENGTIIKEFR